MWHLGQMKCPDREVPLLTYLMSRALCYADLVKEHYDAFEFHKGIFHIMQCCYQVSFFIHNIFISFFGYFIEFFRQIYLLIVMHLGTSSTFQTNRHGSRPFSQLLWKQSVSVPFSCTLSFPPRPVKCSKGLDSSRI